MGISDEKIQDILELKEKITLQIEKKEEELELLKKNLDVLDLVLKQSSFTKASLLETNSKPVEEEIIPLTHGPEGEVIANAYVSQDKVSIIIEDSVGVNAETPPFKTFFLDRIIGEMKRKDSTEVKNGKIQPESVIDYIINKNGTNIREIIIKNYRQKERVQEIINTAAWSLSRMLENTNK